MKVSTNQLTKNNQTMTEILEQEKERLKSMLANAELSLKVTRKAIDQQIQHIQEINQSI